MLQPETFRRFD